MLAAFAMSAGPATQPASTADDQSYPPGSMEAGEIRPVSSRQLRVALYTDAGSRNGGDNVEKALQFEPTGFKTQRVTAAEVRAGVLKDFDVFVAGGGSGSKIAQALEEKGREEVVRFVKSGGGYVGICAGAYLVSSDYAWSLHLLNAKVVDRAHWARGGGEVTLSLSERGREILGRSEERLVCLYNQGPLLAPADKEGLVPYTALATYESEIAKKGAPSGVMVGTTAIAEGKAGEGRVVAISAHPEKWLKYNEMIRRVVAYVGKAEPAFRGASTQADR